MADNNGLVFLPYHILYIVKKKDLKQAEERSNTLSIIGGY